MGNCCSSDIRQVKKKPSLPSYKFCILRSPQFPNSTPIPSEAPETPFYIKKHLNAFSGAKPIILNLWIKQNLFTAESLAKEARSEFYSEPHTILIEVELAHKTALEEIQRNLLDEIRSAQREAQENGRELMIVMIGKGRKLGDEKDGIQKEKIKQYAENKGWVVMFTESTDDYLETEYREISEKLGDVGILPEKAMNLEDSGIGSFYSDSDEGGFFVQKVRKESFGNFGNFGDEE